MPRNQYAIKQSESNIDDISGSVNEESGSVLSSISGKNLTNEIGTKPEEHKIVRPISKQVNKFKFYILLVYFANNQ